MQFWCIGFLFASHVGGGKSNTFHRKCVIIFHISKYHTKAAAWVVELRQISSKINYFLLRSIHGSSSYQGQFQSLKIQLQSLKKTQKNNSPWLGVPTLYNY